MWLPSLIYVHGIAAALLQLTENLAVWMSWMTAWIIHGASMKDKGPKIMSVKTRSVSAKSETKKNSNKHRPNFRVIFAKKVVMNIFLIIGQSEAHGLLLVSQKLEEPKTVLSDCWNEEHPTMQFWECQ